MASQAARRMCSGVSKSGSPIARLTMVLPWRRSSAMRSVAVLLGEGLMRRMRAAIREGATAVSLLVTGPWNGKPRPRLAPRRLLSGRITAPYGPVQPLASVRCRLDALAAGQQGPGARRHRLQAEVIQHAAHRAH